MTLNNLYSKIKIKLILLLIQKPRVYFYSFLSSIKIDVVKLQPVLVNGKGKIKISNSVTFGVKESPYYYSGYSYLEARREESYIEIGDNCFINNSASIISDGKKIVIKHNCLIGSNFQIMDSDFHELNPNNRFGGKNIIKKDVMINENVFIGNNVTILKGVVIGKNSVIGNNSVVTKSIPQNVIAGGNPAKVIREL
jgi:acetyltransferase-like isoleucine patch superfamily enzyme